MGVEERPGSNIDAIAEEIQDTARLKQGEDTSLSPDEVEKDVNWLLKTYSQVPSEERLKPEDLMANMHGDRILSVGEGRFEIDPIELSQPLSQVELDSMAEALQGQVDEVLAPLTDDERRMIEDFFGLKGRFCAEDQIAEERGMPESQVREVIDRALQKLHPPEGRKTLLDYLG